MEHQIGPPKPEEDRSELSTAPDLQIAWWHVVGHPSTVGKIISVACRYLSTTWRAGSRYFQDDFISSKGAKCQLRGEGLLELLGLFPDFSRSTFQNKVIE